MMIEAGALPSPDENGYWYAPELDKYFSPSRSVAPVQRQEIHVGSIDQLSYRDIVDFETGTIAKLIQQTRQLQIKNDQAEGLLVKKDDVEKFLKVLIHSIRSAVISMPSRYAPIISAKLDCDVLLIQGILQEFSDELMLQLKSSADGPVL